MRMRIAAPLALAALCGSANAADDTPPSYASTTLTGAWNGVRDQLRARGVTFTLTGTGDVLGNVAGGLKTAAAYDNLFELQGDFDLSLLAGWTGAKLHIAGYAIAGPGLTVDVGNLLTITSVEAEPGLRLGEVFVSQGFLTTS